MRALLYAGAVRPDELLEDLGVHSEPIRILVTVLALLSLTAGGIASLFKAIGWIRRRLQLRDPLEQERLRRRQLFASFVEGRVRDLDRREEWADYRFSELEAEVETVEESGPRHGLKRLMRRQDGLRREKSLSKALVGSSDRLILLRGDPGSGKSVALRHVARKLAGEAIEARRLDAVIPLYVNLKDLRRGQRPIDVRLIEDFVLETVERGGDREVHSFLKDEFRAGMAAGGWLFLFDSFDELPEVLSSTEDDEIIRTYSDAISQFVEGMHSCRGVLASRHFRAPQKQGPPTYRIVPLTEKRKRDLIAKANVGEAETQLVADLAALPPELATLSANPLFLGLLVEFVKERKEMPEGWHDVFEAFVSRRLETDRKRVQQLFQLSDTTLRTRSEEIAFTMTDTVGFGLSPTRKALRDAYRRAGFGDGEDLEAVLSALAWTKLGRLDTETAKQEEETFTFAHRRFQEYFATCIVLREPGRVDNKTLLTDGSWRETAVTLCHAQPEAASSLVDEAEALLVEVQEATEGRPRGDFRWRPGTLHLLGLLQSAFAGRTQYLRDSLRQRVAAVLRDADERGTITDRKWVLETAGTAPADDMAALLLKAFRGMSDWLREVAYRQVARLGRIPVKVSIEIKRALIERTARGELLRDWPATTAQLLRLQPPQPYLQVARLLRAAPIVDALVFLGGYMVAAMVFQPSPRYVTEWALVAAVAHVCYYPTALVIARLPDPLMRESTDEWTAWTRSGVGFLHFVAISIRLLVTAVPVLLAVLPWAGEPLSFGLVKAGEGGGSAVGSFVWFYASTWSLVATYFCLAEPGGVLAWPFIPLRLLWTMLARMRAADLIGALKASGWLLFVIAMGAAGAAISYGLQHLPRPLDVICSGILLLAIFGSALYGAAHSAVRFVRDRASCRRWLASIKTGMSAEDLVDCLGELHRPASAYRILHEVRNRRVLLNQSEAPAVVRDLLQAVDPDGLDGAEPASWRSPAFESWQKRNPGAPSWLRFDEGVPDELGRLLEELEREGEVPVA